MRAWASAPFVHIGFGYVCVVCVCVHRAQMQWHGGKKESDACATFYITVVDVSPISGRESVNSKRSIVSKCQLRWSHIISVTNIRATQWRSLRIIVESVAYARSENFRKKKMFAEKKNQTNRNIQEMQSKRPIMDYDDRHRWCEWPY